MYYVTYKGISPLDLAVGVLLAAVAYVPIIGPAAFPLAHLLLVTVCAIAVCFRRSAPLSTASVIFVATAIRLIITNGSLVASDAAVLIALYTVVAYADRWARLPALLAAIVEGTLVVIPLLRASNPAKLDAPLAGLAMLASILFTWSTALLRRRQLLDLTNLVTTAKETQRLAEKESALAVAEERTRISREMHDIVAHTLSVVIAQADGGRYAAQKDPAIAVRALETISEVSRAALGDVRSIIGALRDGPAEEVPLLPQPVETDLDDLIATVGDSGIPISFVKTGDPRPVPVGVGNALYRICQEALTNVMKHGGPAAHVSVLLEWGARDVHLTIVDTGRGAAAPSKGSGHGLIGMNERAAVFGGRVEAGPQAGGGFRVHCTIPLQSVPTHSGGKDDDSHRAS